MTDTRVVTVYVDGSKLIRYRDGVTLRTATESEAEYSAQVAEQDEGKGLFEIEETAQGGQR